MKAHNVVRVEHTSKRFQQPTDIAATRPPLSLPHLDQQCNTVIVIDLIIAHRPRGKGFQFLALPRGAPSDEAE